MSGFFGVASKEDCIFDLFFGTDYHSHLGTRRFITKRKVFIGQFTTLKTLLSEPNLTKT